MSTWTVLIHLQYLMVIEKTKDQCDTYFYFTMPGFPWCWFEVEVFGVEVSEKSTSESS